MFLEMIDRKTFEGCIGHYGASYADNNYSREVLATMLNNHVNNKKHIFELFGNKLKIEKEIEVSVNDYQSREIRERLCETLSTTLPREKIMFALSLLRNIRESEFIANTLEEDIEIFNLTIKKGTKISKALMRLVLPEHQEAVAIAHSMANQKLFSKGKVVLSIDPIDYLTMSSNSSGWKSCHRLNGGEYRTGPLAYLNDSSTVICYIESKTPCTFSYRGEDFTHSNKIWRQIALVSPNLEFSIQERQYPSTNVINEKAVAGLFISLFSDYHKKDFKLEKVSSQVITDLHRDYAECNGEGFAALYYNDTLHHMYDDSIIVYSSTIKNCTELINSNPELPIKGYEAYCLSCGSHLYDSGDLYCEECSETNSDDDEW